MRRTYALAVLISASPIPNEVLLFVFAYLATIETALGLGESLLKVCSRARRL